jgi:UDP-glucuronate decarboxylase
MILAGVDLNATSPTAERVLRLTGSRSRRVRRPLPQNHPIQRCPDITLANWLLDKWQPTVPLDGGPARTIGYFDELTSASRRDTSASIA